MAMMETVTDDRGLGPTVRALPRGLRLGVVQELLDDLDTATIGGRSFTMEKVLWLLGEEIGAVEPALSEIQRRAVTRALAELRREHARPMPDTGAFVARTHTLTATLELL